MHSVTFLLGSSILVAMFGYKPKAQASATSRLLQVE